MAYIHSSSNLEDSVLHLDLRIKRMILEFWYSKHLLFFFYIKTNIKILLKYILKYFQWNVKSAYKFRENKNGLILDKLKRKKKRCMG